jgi:hypothetical protein
MRSKNLYFNSGEGKLDNQQIVLSGARSVIFIDGSNEFQIDNVRKIEIKEIEHNKMKIKLDSNFTFISCNKNIAINEDDDIVFVEMLNTEEQLAKYTKIVNNQEAHGLIDYIKEHAPDLYSLEALMTKPLDELRKLKESMDDLANCY